MPIEVKYVLPVNADEKEWLKAEVESERIWDLWRLGKISYEQVQQAHDIIFEVTERKGFFKKLQNEINHEINQKIPMRYRDRFSVLQYAVKADEVVDKFLVSDLTSFWQNCGWFKDGPTQQDVTNLSDGELAQFFIMITNSLRNFVDNGLEDSEQAEQLHQIYLILKGEIEKRPTLPQLPQQDGFLNYINIKQTLIQKEQLKQQEIINRPQCPSCGAKGSDIMSYGASWYCKKCGRKFLKNPRKKLSS